MIRIVPLKFQQAGRQYDFNALTLEIAPGDKVIVETDRGRAMATVVTAPKEIDPADAPEGLKNILRVATDEDMALAQANAAREKDAHTYCLERIKDRQLEMKLVRAEYAFDGSKIIFFFTADGRIDFRELVKDLAHHFHTRIEMRQIGVRDEAKLVGGLGICGRELCCCSFLTQFNPVSVKMAKEQGLALNPTKISGQCGRLLCCLGYEFETYTQLKKGMPKCGKKVVWQEREHEVTNIDILRQQISLRDKEGTTCCITLKELQTGQALTSDPQEKEESETHSSRLGNDRGQRKPVVKKPQQVESKTTDDTQPPPEQKKEGQEQQKTDGKPSKNRRRRGRRRPRGGRKPNQTK